MIVEIFNKDGNTLTVELSYGWDRSDYEIEKIMLSHKSGLELDIADFLYDFLDTDAINYMEQKINESIKEYH